MDIKVSYDGRFPNLCRGHLVITIDGTVWDFGKYALMSTGEIHRSEDWDMWATSGPWVLNEYPEGFPDDECLRENVLEAINEQLSWGCCGGCI